MFDKNCYVGPLATDAFGAAVQAMYGRIRQLEQELSAVLVDLYVVEDSKRLQWMQFNGARVEWENDGEVCSVSWSNRDGSYRTKLFDDWRLAIDAARRLYD
jgi:hypothetical protein